MTNLPLPPATAAVAVADMDGTGEILRRTARGAGWIVGWRMATRLLGLVNTLILTRLLLPTDFGLVALGSSFVVSLDCDVRARGRGRPGARKIPKLARSTTPASRSTCCARG